MASEQLRTLLGPEDVVLAKRTDPLSIRALFSNIHNTSTNSSIRNSHSNSDMSFNVAFPMSIQATNCWKETLFWFGPRYTDRSGSDEISGSSSSRSSSRTGNLCPCSLVLPAERVVVLGIALQCVDSAFLSHTQEEILQKASMVSNELATMQRDLLHVIQGLSAETMQLLTMWTVRAEEYQKYGLECASVVSSEEEEDKTVPSCFMVLLLKTTSGDANLQSTATALEAAAVKRSSQALYWRAVMSLKVRHTFKRYIPATILQDVKHQIAHAEVARELDLDTHEEAENEGGREGVVGSGKQQLQQQVVSQLGMGLGLQLDEEDFESHEDVGLQVSAGETEGGREREGERARGRDDLVLVLSA